jgi:hypothetical protein
VATTDLLYQPRMIGEDACGEIGGIKIGMGNRSTQRKPAQAVSLWLPIAAPVRVRAARGVCGGQAALGQVFFEYVGFPCQSSFHQFIHYHNHQGWQCRVDPIGLHPPIDKLKKIT